MGLWECGAINLIVMITTSDYQKLVAFINAILFKSFYRGTILAGDIANSIFLAHPKMSVNGMMALVRKFLTKEINAERTARLNAKALEQKKIKAKNSVALKRAEEPEYKALCNKRNNEWEKNNRRNNAAWKKRRNKKQRDKKREQRKNKKKQNNEGFE